MEKICFLHLFSAMVYHIFFNHRLLMQPVVCGITMCSLFIYSRVYLVNFSSKSDYSLSFERILFIFGRNHPSEVLHQDCARLGEIWRFGDLRHFVPKMVFYIATLLILSCVMIVVDWLV